MPPTSRRGRPSARIRHPAARRDHPHRLHSVPDSTPYAAKSDLRTRREVRRARRLFRLFSRRLFVRHGVQPRASLKFHRQDSHFPPAVFRRDLSCLRCADTGISAWPGVKLFQWDEDRRGVSTPGTADIFQMLRRQGGTLFPAGVE
jgi:hypothetical protein